MLDKTDFLWDSIDQMEGEMGLNSKVHVNLSLYGGICMVVVTPGR